MISINPDIQNTISFFQTTFTIIIALSIGESFKQFVADKAERPEDRSIHWDRLPSLISFLFVALPFFHGMNRYFFLAYANAKTVPDIYGAYLIFDGLCFISMSALLFAMSRTLPAVQWRRFFSLILLLLVVDSIWIAAAIDSRGFPVGVWQLLNASVIIMIVAMLAREPRRPIVFTILCALMEFLTTAISYAIEWNVFFPR
jgi:hypothetical protein